MNPEKTLILTDQKKNELLLKSLKEIVYFETAGCSTQFYCCKGKKYMLEKRMNRIEEKLPQKVCFRIYNSFIVNTAYIKKVNIKERKVVLLNDIDQVVLPIAHRRL